MTEQHPLTDEVIGKTFNFSGKYTSRWYDEEDMRAAADWQMKQAIDRFNDYHLRTFGWSPAIIELERLLRPTTKQEDNSD